MRKIEKIKIKQVKKSILNQMDELIRICKDKDVKNIVKAEEKIYLVED